MEKISVLDVLAYSILLIFVYILRENIFDINFKGAFSWEIVTNIKIDEAKSDPTFASLHFFNHPWSFDLDCFQSSVIF